MRSLDSSEGIREILGLVKSSEDLVKVQTTLSLDCFLLNQKEFCFYLGRPLLKWCLCQKVNFRRNLSTIEHVPKTTNKLIWFVSQTNSHYKVGMWNANL